MKAGAAGDTLYGRENELQAVTDLVAGLPRGTGGALMVSGEPGIGKSALLAAAGRLAKDSDVQVLTATGIQAETRLPFAGLHQMLRPVLPVAGRLPPRQREALFSAFGMTDADPAAPFLIGLAALELLSEAASGTPVLLIADDGQWLDESSCNVLGFVARRLATEPAALLVAVRDGLASPFDRAGLPELRLSGLIDSDAAELLDCRFPGLDPVLRHQLLAEAAGNPLALVELPKTVRRGQPAPHGLTVLPLTARLERAFAAQAKELPAATRAVLLAAAADDEDGLAEVLATASILIDSAVSDDALVPAIEAGIAEIDGAGLRFRHPLMRSAIYQTASTSQRLGAHAALAAILDRHPDRRAWHRAAAVFGPDEEVAAELEAAAVSAQRRGAVVMAIDAFRRAAHLSEDGSNRGRRLQLGALTAFESGDPELGEDLLRSAESADVAADLRTWAAYERETFSGGAWSGATMVDSIVGLADRMRAAGQSGTARDALLSIAMRCYWGNPGESTRAAVIAAAEKLPVPESDPGLLLILASADPVRLGTVVNTRVEGIGPDETDPAGMYLAGLAAGTVWSWDRSLTLLEAGVNGLRRQARLGLLVQALVTQAWAALHSSRIAAALSAADEAARLAPETGQGHWAHAARLVKSVVAAASGNADAAAAMTQESESGYRAMGAAPNLGLVLFARGRGAVVNQQYAEGLTYLRRILDPTDPAHHPYVGIWGLGDLVDAAARIGERDVARTYLDQLESLAEASSGSHLLAMAAYARPLVADGEAAEQLYQAALADELARWPDYRARMLLRYGEWLRRQRRAAESRPPLREARNSFDAIGLASLAERARLELRAAGESSGRREPRPWDQLTPQELQIAQMAADGMSNREIGQQLYISHRTVSAHLYRVFPKLGITSRSQLHVVNS